MTERKLEIERSAGATKAKLPELKIPPFEGTPVDWIRFENMFRSQVDRQPMSDEEKFGYLLEMVSPKVREKISNLKPGTEGYKKAWERLKCEYGQTKVVENVQTFYEQLSKNVDALQTLGESEMLKGFVLATLNKLPQVNPDIVRTDNNWENWAMEDLLGAMQKWLRRNKVEEPPKRQEEKKGRKERSWYTVGRSGDEDNKDRVKRKPKPHCLYCDKEHWGESCGVVGTLAKRREFFMMKRL